MAFKLADRVRETSVTTGTGTMTLAGAVSGYRAFSSVLSNGDTCFYFIAMGVAWESGIGTYSGGTLARTTVIESTNANSAVNFGAGTKDVWIGLPGTYAQPLKHLTYTTSALSCAVDFGVGVAAPNELMEIGAATGARMLLSNAGGATRKGIIFQSPGSVTGYASIFAYDYGATAGVNLVFQINGGNTGFGTVTPQKQFVISKSGIGFEVAPDDPSSPGAVRTLAYDRGASAYVQFILESDGVGLDVASVDANYGLQLPNSSSKKAKANAWDTYSDARIKPPESRAPIVDPLAIVMAMNPMMFDQYDSDGLTLRSTYKRTIGFIAQDEEPHAPWLVSQGSTPSELWSLDYGRTSVLAIAGLQALVARVTTLEESVQLLQQQ